ncbi:RNA-directed DNA polymerase, eukaryota, reverse transcriptase zinc-binding domain protein [Tanacetum coccineum]
MGKLLGEVNANLISLVPKVQNPDKVSEFRPIACCNVIYKCISKIITNRLKRVLGRLVHESQSAFIAGRRITDNILLARELFKGYNRKQKIKNVTFKIDLQKAYDTIDWNFLRVVLEQFGFPKMMVEWIIVCVSTTKFSININGEREGYFSSGKGLRQGDPMSPYMFTLVMEAFNIIMRKNISENKEFKYHYGCHKLGITHLCFVDDLLVFFHGDTKLVSVIKEALEEFSSYSGLKANMSKSIVFFGGLTNAEQNVILGIVPFAIGKLPVRYLGVPLITKKINATDYKPLVEKVKNRVLDWRNKALSYSGRLQLIASVLRELTKWKAKVSWEKGILCDIVTSREIYEAGLRINTTIADLVTKYEGNWPEGWSNEYSILNQCVVPRLHEGTSDKPIWVDKNSKENLFSIKQVWKDLNGEETKVDWRLVFGAVVYYTWQERNNRVFREETRDEKSLIQTIKETVQLKIAGFEVKDSSAVREVESRWNIQI